MSLRRAAISVDNAPDDEWLFDMTSDHLEVGTLCGVVVWGAGVGETAGGVQVKRLVSGL